jgi:hypothetical protein
MLNYFHFEWKALCILEKCLNATDLKKAQRTEMATTTNKTL